MEVKLPIWLPSIKSRESPQFPCVQVACNIPLESSWQWLQLCFRPHFNQRSTHKVMGPQSCESPSCGNFKTPAWESQDKMTFGCWSLWPSIEYTIRGKVVASPKSGPWWVLWICVCSWLVRAPRCSNYALTNLLFGLCKSAWVSKLLVNLPRPIPKL